MHSTTAFLNQLQRIWRSEPQPEKLPGIFWLTPEQRIAIVKELLYPLDDKPSK